MDAKPCCCCEPKAIAPALLRWGLGLLFLLAGIGKLPDVAGFVRGYLVPAYEKTFLPGWMVLGYGYALPFVEAALGVLLILGICRNFALLLTGVTLLSLAFGQMLVKQNVTVAQIFMYLLMTAVALWMSERDTWTVRRLCGGGKCNEPPPV